MHCYKLEDLDIVMVAEITLRLSEILESLGNPKRKFKKSGGELCEMHNGTGEQRQTQPCKSELEHRAAALSGCQ